MALTALDIVTDALRLVMVLDITEAPDTTHIAQGVKALNSMLLHEFADKSSSWKVSRHDYTVPADTQKITISPTGDIVVDARSVRAVWRAINGGTIYPLERVNEDEVFKVDVKSQPTSYYDERKADGSVDIYFWPTPNIATGIRVSVSERMDEITGETSVLSIPDDAKDAVTYLLAARLRPLFGVPLETVGDVIATADKYRETFKMRNRANSYIKLR